LNWGYDLVAGDDKEKYDVGLIQASTAENKALDEAYVERLTAAYDELAVEAYVGGSFVNLQVGQVYYGFDKAKNVANIPMPEGIELCVGLDFNVDPMSAIIFWKNGIHMHVVDEIELPNSDTLSMCDEIHKRWPKQVRDVYPDASGNARKTASPGGKSDFHWIREAGFTVKARSKNPHLKDRYNAVNAKLRPAGGAQPTMTVSPKCKKLIKHLMMYSHQNSNTEAGKAMGHLLDALGYPVSYLYPVVRNVVEQHDLRGM